VWLPMCILLNSKGSLPHVHFLKILKQSYKLESREEYVWLDISHHYTLMHRIFCLFNRIIIRNFTCLISFGRNKSNQASVAKRKQRMKHKAQEREAMTGVGHDYNDRHGLVGAVPTTRGWRRLPVITYCYFSPFFARRNLLSKDLF